MTAVAPKLAPTAAQIRRYESLIAFNDRTASQFARERNRKAWATLAADLAKRGCTFADCA